MAIKTRIDPIENIIKLIVANTLSVPAQQEAVASFAAGAIKQADATNQRVLGRIPPRTITVDGRPGAPLDSVKPDGGSIIVEWEIVTDVLTWICQTLRERSPVISGDYRDGWTLLADGNEVSEGGQTPTADVYTFVNTVPYARRIEVGKTESGRDFVIQVPNRIAERTAKDAQSRFGNIARIQSTFISLTNSYALRTNGASRSFVGGRLRVRHRPDRSAGSAVTYPAVTVTLKAA